MEKKLIITKDGSPSFEVGALKETYHSRHGARTESEFVYIQQGLAHWHRQQQQCRVFELGFGTGCNALLAYEYAQKHQLTLEYTTIEKYPLSETDLEALKQHTYASTATGQDFFQLAHALPWNKKETVAPSVHFEKILGDYFEYSPKTRFDVVFYDAFGAHAQADLWAPTALEKAVELMDTNAVWVSYCAKGSVRRALQSFGLHVERLPGPPGKREMLRGTRVE